ncbi:MAG TPA: ABC transporter substrate-binding protein [Burkholderiaceae bacterium]|nr:ABC transporter substrate-binding protein [Burkholderiaceae bacterium]
MTSSMDRRTMLGGAASLGLLVAARHAVGQRPVKPFRIGYLNLRAGPNAWDEALVQRLRELGYRNGDNLLIEYRWADEDLSLLERQADELVRLPVDVIVTNQTPAVRIVKKATATIPIVMIATADPVGSGLISSFARPGGNLTGLSYLTTDLAAKRLELLHELVPGAARIAVLAWDFGGRNPASKERGPTMLPETEAAGRLLGAEVRAHFIGSAADLPQAFAAIEQARSQALIVKHNSFIYEHRAAIIEASKRLRLPDMYEAREFVATGGLVSYGPNVTELYRQAAGYVDRIFKGAKPADLPVQQPTRLDLVLNLKTAKAIGLTIPQSLLLRADEVIQ